MIYEALDVRDALFARDTDGWARTERCTAYEFLYSMSYGEEDFQAEYARYLAGKKILEEATLVTTGARFDSTNEVAFLQESDILMAKGIDSYIVDVDAGFVATSSMCKVYALKCKEQ